MLCMFCFRWCRVSRKVSFRDSVRHARRCKRDADPGFHLPDAINATVEEWSDS